MYTSTWLGDSQVRSKRDKCTAWGVCSQGWNSKELTGARTSGGACGLIRWYARNLTRAWHTEEYFRDRVAACRLCTGAAWLSSARAVKCWVKSRNERNPYFQLPSLSWGLWKNRLWQTGGRWGRRQVITALMSWATHVLQWLVQSVANSRGQANRKKPVSVRIGVCNSTPWSRNR